MSAKEHYDNHLADFYSWMTGDFNECVKSAEEFFACNNIKPELNKIAVDLGAGHGIYSIPLLKIGYKVRAVDFNMQLLNELKNNAGGIGIEIFEDDIVEFSKKMKDIELCLCMGDTLPHLDSFETVKLFLINIYNSLLPSGKLILSFRDYSISLQGIERFIPVKADDQKILTCFLEYSSDFVTVNDLLYEKNINEWNQKISSYKKIRLTKKLIKEMSSSLGFSIIKEETVKGMIFLFLQK